jgi:hypothetical protein
MPLTDILKFLGSKLFLFFALIVGVILLTSGCTALGKFADKSADKIAPLIDKYCEETSAEVRLELRQRINDRTNGNEIEIRCAVVDDPIN